MDKCPTCRAPAIHEGERYQFDSSQYHMAAVKKLSEISALNGYIEDLEKVVEAAKETDKSMPVFWPAGKKLREALANLKGEGV